MESLKCTIAYDDGQPNSGTFLFDGETHTMGNALRQAINANPEVEFCGYSVPHPAEKKMKIRIQAQEGSNIINIMNQGLDNFATWCDNLSSAFTDGMQSYTV